MCTLITVSRTLWDANTNAIRARIHGDARSNPDGMSLLLIDKLGASHQLTTFEPRLITAFLKSLDWVRMIFHSRFATAGEVSLANTHGWAAAGVFVFHNGSIRHKDAYQHAVDSQAICQWIDEDGIGDTLQALSHEPFANVILYDGETGRMFVNRSTSGALFTDGAGNFSTNPIKGLIVLPVKPGAQSFQCKPNKRGRIQTYGNLWSAPKVSGSSRR